MVACISTPTNPAAVMSGGSRGPAPQSLTLLNAEEVLGAAARTAERLTEAADSPEGCVTLAYRLIIERPPTAVERLLSVEFLARSPLSERCRGLFNLNAFF